MLCIDREHTLLSFVREVGLQFRPHGFCALRRPREELFVTSVGRDIADDEIANVDGILPIPGSKAPPAISGIRFLLKSRARIHGRLPSQSCVDWLGFAVRRRITPRLSRAV